MDTKTTKINTKEIKNKLELQKSNKYVNMFKMVNAYAGTKQSKPNFFKNKLYHQLSKNLVTISQTNNKEI